MLLAQYADMLDMRFHDILSATLRRLGLFLRWFPNSISFTGMEVFANSFRVPPSSGLGDEVSQVVALTCGVRPLPLIPQCHFLGCSVHTSRMPDNCSDLGTTTSHLSLQESTSTSGSSGRCPCGIVRVSQDRGGHGQSCGGVGPNGRGVRDGLRGRGSLRSVVTYECSSSGGR